MRYKVLFALGIFLAGFTFFVIKDAHELLYDSIIAKEIASRFNNLNIDRVNFSKQDDNTISYEIFASAGNLDSDDSKVKLVNPIYISYLDSGSIDKIIGSKYAIFDNESSEITISGDIFLIEGDMSLVCSNIMSKSGGKIFESSDPVYIAKKDFVVKGLGLVVDLEKKSFHIKSNVSAIFKAK